MAWYAAQHPRGFGNEYTIHVFGSRRERDAWVAARCNDGDVNSAARGGYALPAREARRMMRARGDDVTTIFRRVEDHRASD